MGFYDNFIRLCNARGESPSKVATNAGSNRSAVTRWKNGSTPTTAMVAKLADYFGVSQDELTSETVVNKQNAEQQTAPAPSVDAVTAEMLQLVLSATHEEKTAMVEMLRFIRKQRKE